MKATKQAGWVLVSVPSETVNEFNRHYPCSPIPDDADFLIELDSRNGDLVNITAHVNDAYVDSSEFDGSALLALTLDATNFAVNAGYLPQWAKRV
jgi:hypothetical protein